MKFRIGGLFECSKITDAYFSVTAIRNAPLGYVLTGYWLNKKTGKTMTKEPTDYLLPRPADWSEVKNAKFRAHLRLLKK